MEWNIVLRRILASKSHSEDAWESYCQRSVKVPDQMMRDTQVTYQQVKGKVYDHLQRTLMQKGIPFGEFLDRGSSFEGL
jgi:hypothetical protein